MPRGRGRTTVATGRLARMVPNPGKKSKLERYKAAMNRGYVVPTEGGSQFDGSCQYTNKECAFRPSRDGRPSQHTCPETGLARWQCTASRLYWALMEYVETLRGTNADGNYPHVNPETIHYKALTEYIMGYILENTFRSVVDPPMPSRISFPYPSIFYGDSGVLEYLRNIARFLPPDMYGMQRIPAEQLQELLKIEDAGELAEKLEAFLESDERRQLRVRLVQWKTVKAPDSLKDVVAALVANAKPMKVEEPELDLRSDDGEGGVNEVEVSSAEEEDEEEEESSPFRPIPEQTTVWENPNQDDGFAAWGGRGVPRGRERKQVDALPVGPDLNQPSMDLDHPGRRYAWLKPKRAKKHQHHG